MSPPLGFQILYEQGKCLVVNKPPGVLTQAVPGVDSLAVRIKAYLHTNGAEEDPYVGVPHRLDRPATGAIVFAKDLRTTRKLGEQFEKRYVQKVYWACVEGAVTPEFGRWEDYVYKVAGEPRAEVVGPEHPEGRTAALQYRVVKTFDWGSWLEIELETGRTHQIRIQAASRGHPVLGDKQYGSTIAFGPQFDDVRLQAIALHARSLTFRDPETRQMATVEAPVADYWPEGNSVSARKMS
jgi:23S rRNA pseudouridine1911/1915/1917 synthase